VKAADVKILRLRLLRRGRVCVCVCVYELVDCAGDNGGPVYYR